MNFNDLPDRVQDALVGRGIEPDEVAVMSPKEIYTEFCEWYGLIGWGSLLWETAFTLNKIKWEQES